MDTSPTRLLIHGASGRMGQALLRLAAEQPHACTVAATELGGVPAFDAAVDCSLPEGFDAVLGLCVDRGCPLVSGTTGIDAAQQDALATAATRIPLVWASNFSLGVAVLAELVERAAAALPGWDVDIVESHHVHKKDAPSGTALTLGHAAGGAGQAVRYASLRAGDIVGEHMVQFTGLGERIELTHRATHRDIFARGALHVARSLVGRPPGAYRVRDLLD